MVSVIASQDLGVHGRLATVTRRGCWWFGNGLLGLPVTPSADGADAGAEPRWRSRRAAVQAERIFDGLLDGLAGAGLGPADLVRVDQYYPGADVVEPYQIARGRALGSTIPPSTSVVVDELLLPRATAGVNAVAIEGAHADRVVLTADAGSMPREASGFAPALRVGELVFLAGQTAAASDGSGIAPEAAVNDAFAWGGSPIRKQARYVLTNLLRLAEVAGARPDQVLYAQVYLASMEMLPELDEVWRELFGDHGPARVVVPASGLALRDGVIEVNLVATTAAVDRWAGPDDGRPDTGPGVPSVAAAGDVAMVSGVSASARAASGASPGGRVLRVADAVDHPYTYSRATRETELIVDEVEERLASSGRSLADVVRITQFHTDLRDFLPSLQVWSRRLGRPVPLSAVRTPGPLTAADDAIVCEAWAVST